MSSLIRALLGAAVLAAAPAALAQPAPAAPLPKQAALAIKGVYAGSYKCTDGEHGFYLDIKTVAPAKGGGFAVTGVLGLFPTLAGAGGSSAGAAGSFNVAGTISDKNEIAMTAGKWVKQAPGYGAANLAGTLSKNADGSYAIKGKPVVPGRPDMCSDLIATQFLK
jgi:hypothetical protein